MKRTLKRSVLGLGVMVLTGVAYVACSSCCVRAGSMVMTPAGLVPIESVEVGDTVLSYDPHTKTLSENEVAETYDKVGFSWVKAAFSDGTCLGATD